MNRLTAGQVAAQIAVVMACLIIGSADAQELVADVNRWTTWGINLIRAIGVIIFIAAAIAFANGRRWEQGLIALIGVAAAARADVIAPFLFGT